MKFEQYPLLLILLFVMACGNGEKEVSQEQIEQWETEIINTEKAFLEMSLKDGMAKAFEHFADSNAVLARNNELIKGPKNIRAFYDSKPQREGQSLTWAPEHVSVASSGDLAYTYGKYEFVYQPDSGEAISSTGYFQTIWKHQSDGSWKYVWD